MIQKISSFRWKREKKVTPLPFFPENVHRDEPFKFSKFSSEFPRFSYKWSALYAFISFFHERFRTWPHFESDGLGNSEIPFLSNQCLHSLWPTDTINSLFTDSGKRELYATTLVSRLPLIPSNHGKAVGIWLRECLFLDWLLGGWQWRGSDGGVHGPSHGNQLHVTCLRCSCHRQQ